MLKTAQYVVIYVYLLQQGDRGEAGPVGKGERGEPGVPGPKVSLILHWKCFVSFTPMNTSFPAEKDRTKTR